MNLASLLSVGNATSITRALAPTSPSSSSSNANPWLPQGPSLRQLSAEHDLAQAWSERAEETGFWTGYGVIALVVGGAFVLHQFRSTSPRA
jgi:hypothetical protein